MVSSLTSTPVEAEEPIKYNDEIGAFVDPKTDDKVSQATLLDWAANNPMPTAAIASAPLLSKTVRKTTGKLLSGLLKTLGSPTAAATFAGLTIKENLEKGKSIPDAVIDPLVGVELLFPELAKRATTSPTGTGLLSRAGRFLLNPIPRAAAAMTPIGAGITALGIGKELYSAAQEEQDRINEMRENDPIAYQEYLAEQQELMECISIMDRRTFMKLLGGLASMPIVGRIAKPLQSETVREGIASVSEGGMKLYEMVVAKVIKEGKKIGESGRVDSYKHPDRPDITVDVNQTDGSAEIYFDTDKGSKGYAKIDRDMETGGTDLQEAEEVFTMQGDKDIEEGIRGGIENLEEFTRLKKAGGGEVNLTIVRMPDINESGVESLFKTR